MKVSTLVWPAARYSTAESATCSSRSATPPVPVPVVSVSLDRRQRAERAADGVTAADAVHVGQVDVGEGDGAAVGQIAGRGDLLGHRADQIRRRDHRRIVGAGDGDVDLRA